MSQPVIHPEQLPQPTLERQRLLPDGAEAQVAGERKEVAFIDTSVTDFQSLVDGVRPGVEVVLLEAGQNGLAQMAEWARTHSGYDAIHVLSHGATGRLRLGSDTVDLTSLNDVDVQTQLAALGQSLTAAGDLLIYGCEVAKGEAGLAFIHALATVTGADVAASDDATGAAAKGGDWELEKSRGIIEAMSAAVDMNDFDATLADKTFSLDTVNFDNPNKTATQTDTPFTL